MDYQGFKGQWCNPLSPLGDTTGRYRVDYDRVFAYQCVDEILQYLYQEANIASGVWGNAIDYANNPTQVFLNHFYKVDQAQQGDIVVLYGLTGNPYGHIGILDHQDASGMWLLEQNATGSGDGLGRSAIGIYRAIPLSRVAAIWRYKNPAPLPVPAPAPARSEVFLPSQAGPWHLYYNGSGLRPGTSDVKAILRPDMFPPGITEKIISWVGDYALVINTQMFGSGTIWFKGTLAQIK